jgi:hypothetical protein
MTFFEGLAITIGVGIAFLLLFNLGAYVLDVARKWLTGMIK